MRNIHVIQANREPVRGDVLLRHIWKNSPNECISWWRYNETVDIDNVRQYTTLNGSFRDIVSAFKVQNIYITSDKEIKDGDWVYNLKNMDILRYQESDMTRSFYKFGWRKIILTTDTDLIKDGVQAIDDEFLKWFVKNPSCEEVEVIYEPKNFLDTKQGWEYEIIIPKEEPKQETIEEVVNNFKKTHVYINEIKQEQDKKLYSEEDLDMFRKFMIQKQNFSKSCLDVFIEQFKKK